MHIALISVQVSFENEISILVYMILNPHFISGLALIEYTLFIQCTVDSGGIYEIGWGGFLVCRKILFFFKNRCFGFAKS